MDKKTVNELAKKIYRAEMNQEPIPPFTENGYPDMTFEEAYEVQMAAVKLKLEAGHVLVGKKVGLTNKAVQRARHISEPDYGHIFAFQMKNQDEPISLSTLVDKPSIEAELAFVLKHDLHGPNITAADVMEATAGIIPAFEIVERRFVPMCTNVVDSVCDNAAAGRFILGSKITPIANLDLRTIGLIIEKNGLPIDMSTSAAVMGNPAEAVAWLANKLSLFDSYLKAGELIMSGSIGLMHVAAAGECYYAFYGNEVGYVKVSFVE